MKWCNFFNYYSNKTFSLFALEQFLVDCEHIALKFFFFYYFGKEHPYFEFSFYMFSNFTHFSENYNLPTSAKKKKTTRYGLSITRVTSTFFLNTFKSNQMGAVLNIG